MKGTELKKPKSFKFPKTCKKNRRLRRNLWNSCYSVEIHNTAYVHAGNN